MKRFLFLLSFFLAWPLQAQDVDLELKGDVTTVQVDKVITVKEDRTLVKGFPFTVIAPAGGALYSWDYPPTWTVRKKARMLEVTAAPKGLATVTANWVVLDWDGKTTPKLTDAFGSVTFDVGEIVPPIPPVPPGPPLPLGLQKAMQDAYTLETDPKRADNVKWLATLFDSMDTVRKSGKITTAKGLQDFEKQATDIGIGPLAIPKVRAAVGAYLVTVLSKNLNTPADDAYWNKAIAEYGNVSAALKGVR